MKGWIKEITVNCLCKDSQKVYNCDIGATVQQQCNNSATSVTPKESHCLIIKFPNANQKFLFSEFCSKAGAFKTYLYLWVNHAFSWCYSLWTEVWKRNPHSLNTLCEITQDTARNVASLSSLCNIQKLYVQW